MSRWGAVGGCRLRVQQTGDVKCQGKSSSEMRRLRNTGCHSTSAGWFGTDRVVEGTGRSGRLCAGDDDGPLTDSLVLRLEVGVITAHSRKLLSADVS